MSYHKAECVASDPWGRCICPELRAAEKRALDAARDAVADARKWPAYLPPNAGDGLFVVITEADALNAIDALREKT